MRNILEVSQDIMKKHRGGHKLIWLDTIRKGLENIRISDQEVRKLVGNKVGW